MDLIVFANGTARFQDVLCRCALGRAGVAVVKREGDGATPVGTWRLRAGFYRADRLPLPGTSLPLQPLSPGDGWCDDPDNARYNERVTLPYPGRTETLWRDDCAYDVIVPLGYNDHPVVPGLGSAIFLHVAKPGWPPTEGCVALALADLLRFLKHAGPESRVIVHGS